jgi:hypothetical protein
LVRTDIGDASVLDPDGLLFDKLSRENIENGTIGDHRIRSDIAKGYLAQFFSLFRIIHGRPYNKRNDPCQKAFAPNPDLENKALLISSHCEHPKGAWQSHS